MSLTTEIGDVVRVRLEYGFGDTKAYNIHHYRIRDVVNIGTGLPSAQGNPIEVAAPFFAEAFFTNLNFAWNDAASTAVNATGCTVQSIYPSPKSRQYSLLAATPIPGQIPNDPMPLQDTVTALKKTAIGQRWGLGRTFFVGLAETSQVGGKIVASQLLNFQVWAGILGVEQVISDDDFTYTFDPVLYAELPGQDPRITKVVQAVLSDDILKTQRRRRPGKGI